jgi:hypothetical protein
VAVAGLAAAVVSSCSSNGAGLPPSLPSGCATPTLHAPETVALAVQHSGTGAIVEAAVCIGGQGPYPFAIASGTGTSVVTPSLASALQLAATGSRLALRGVTCTTTAPLVRVPSWSLGPLSLAGQDVVVASVPTLGLAYPPVGLIGSDVLSRFGAVRIDYQGERLVLATAEEAPPASTVIILGDASTQPTPALVLSAHPHGSPLSILLSPTGTLVSAAVSFGGGAEQFAVDSGSVSSSLAPDLQVRLRLSPAGATATLSGAGCRGSGAELKSGAWALPGVQLPETFLVTQPIAGPTNSEIVGVVGSDVFASFGSVVIDYHGAHFWLGAG